VRRLAERAHESLASASAAERRAGRRDP
jgi:hypothetical protein